MPGLSKEAPVGEHIPDMSRFPARDPQQRLPGDLAR